MHRLPLLFLLPLLACTAPAGSDAGQAPPAVVAGPMLGHLEARRARLWIQVARPALLGLRYREEGETSWRRPRTCDGRRLSTWALPEGHGTAVLDLPGLEAERSWECQVVALEEGEERPLAALAFRTPPPAGIPEAFRVAFGSCAGSSGTDPAQPVWRGIARTRPDLFLWLGDNVYYEVASREWNDPEAMFARWRRQRSLPLLQPVLGAMAHYAIWDDHDYGPDNSDKTWRLRDESLFVFRSFWANPASGSEGVPGVWFSFQRGRVEFLMLDTRYHRDPDTDLDDGGKSLLGAAQRAWLERRLKASRADFKVIVSGTQVLARYHGYESWDLYPRDRDFLLGLIRRERIGGVLFLSGDRHQGEVLRWLPPEVPYPLYEFTSSPLAARVHRPESEPEAPERLPGSLVRQEHFGFLSFQPREGGTELRFEARDLEGRPIPGTDVVLDSRELQAPAREPGG